jgi:hypothetical protein
MCKECIDNNFVEFGCYAKGCAVGYAIRFTKDHLINKSDYEFIEFWIMVEKHSKPETLAVYNYVFKKYYPTIHKKFMTYKLLK